MTPTSVNGFFRNFASTTILTSSPSTSQPSEVQTYQTFPKPQDIVTISVHKTAKPWYVFAMNASLEKELAGLTAKQKAEVIDFLLPDVIGSEHDEIPADVLTELERRDDQHEANPSGGVTLRDFDQKWFGKK